MGIILYLGFIAHWIDPCWYASELVQPDWIMWSWGLCILHEIKSFYNYSYDYELFSLVMWLSGCVDKCKYYAFEVLHYQM